jgi:hypothetical protein
MWNKTEVKSYFIDISARMSQVIFTLLIVTPFIANIFNWVLFSAGLLLFIFITLVGAIIAALKEEGN